MPNTSVHSSYKRCMQAATYASLIHVIIIWMYLYSGLYWLVYYIPLYRMYGDIDLKCTRGSMKHVYDSDQAGEVRWIKV